LRKSKNRVNLRSQLEFSVFGEKLLRIFALLMLLAGIVEKISLDNTIYTKSVGCV
jgi:hypothetical protein